MKTTFMALGLMISSVASAQHTFALKKTDLGATPTYYDNITQTSTENFVYTALIELGDPAQEAEVIVDINYPTTIIFNNDTDVKYNNKETGVNGYVSINGAPYYLNNFYDDSASSTYLIFSERSYVSNIISCGFRF